MVSTRVDAQPPRARVVGSTAAVTPRPGGDTAACASASSEPPPPTMVPAVQSPVAMHVPSRPTRRDGPEGPRLVPPRSGSKSINGQEEPT